ncbi:MAG: GyrI-like domain-containing protein [Syntrophomonadaceae bacterium]
MYQIGDFSIISRLTIKTLRYYHECGLLEPCLIDPESGYRYYDEKCLERAMTIQELKNLDFSIKEIKDILDNCQDDSELLDYMANKQKEIASKMANYENMDKKLAAFIKQTRQAEEVQDMNKNSEIVIKNIPDTLIASIRFRGRYEDAGVYFPRLYKLCGRHASGSPFFLYFDPDYKEENADIEACVPVKTPVEGDGMRSRTLKGGQAITIIHKGPYENLGGSYKKLIDYINQTGLKIIAPSREVYLKGPGMILPRSPRKFLTEIQMLVE